MDVRDTNEKHRGIASWSIRRPIGTLVLTSVIFVLGAMFLSRLPLDLLPRIIYPQIRVGVNNPGVDPGVMEETIAKPLEAALATTQNVTRIETEIEEGRVGVNLHFRYGTNIDVALQDASTSLNRARSQLPVEAQPPTIFKSDPSQIPVYEAAFSSSTQNQVELRSWIEDRLRPQLLTIEGVASVDVSGGLVREIQILLDQERLQFYGITVSEVIQALRAANQDVAAGRVGDTEHELVGKTEGRFKSVDEMRALLLHVGGGRSVPLGEIARVNDTHREQRLWARLDGVPAVKISIRKQPEANTVEVAEQVHEKILALRESRFIPAGLDYEVIQSQASFIRNSVNSVRDSALLGAGLAMLVVFIFLGSLRKTLVIGAAIPLAILATFALMGMSNLTLNIMSMGGLALGVGMLVDNSIVMLENIFRKRDEEGIDDPVEAAHEGASEVTSAVVASTTTSLAAVLPFLLISGLSALIFRELILTISFAILASLGVALTLVPMLSAQLQRVRFTSGLGNSRPLVAFDHLITRARSGYRTWARGALRWRGTILVTSVLLLVGSFWLTRDLGNEFLPQVDDGGVGVGITLPAGSTPEQTNAVATEIERMVREMPHVQSVFTTAGGFLFGGASADRAGRGSLDIRLVPASKRDMTADEWVRAMQRKIDQRGFAGARIGVRPPRIRGLRTSTTGTDISIAVLGDDLRELERLTRDIAFAMRGIPGLENMEPSVDEASPILAIRLDRERAGYLGLSVIDVGQTIRTALDGTIATRYAEGNREYDVRVRLPRDRFTSPENLGSVALFPGRAGGSPVYLRDVADVRTTLAPTGIRRENQNRLLRLNGDVITEVASVGEVSDSIRARLASVRIPDGYGVVLGGEDEAIRESNRQMLIVVSLAIFLVFVVLAVLYESVLNPLVILTAIPLSLIGVGFALWATDTPQSAPVLLGVILLAGIVVNNAILLVEYIEEYRKKGASAIEAAIDAGAVRLRPILMTTLTTVLGMLPLALGIGEGSEMMQPLAVAVVGGMSISTFLTLFVVPGAYIMVHTAGDRLKTWLTGQRSELASAGAPRAEPAGD